MFKKSKKTKINLVDFKAVELNSKELKNVIGGGSGDTAQVYTPPPPPQHNTITDGAAKGQATD